MNLLFLTCANKDEAEKIKKVLHEKKLVVCAKMCSVSSSFLWNGKVDNANEVMLIMDSREDLFEQVETEIRKVHSYDTFVLLSVPVTRSSKGIREWIDEELKD
ncbi:MAG: divalent-cation tolerance protein CutA [Patescibacteria group bacterium]|nr:divalent-cation tolerance protein CutA [Patescibacteria group bacterium]